MRENFDELKLLIKNTLLNSGFATQSNEIHLCNTEDGLNNTIIRQYTEKTGLYEYVNEKLRECHLYQDYDAKVDDQDDKFMAPWILQLSSCIKKLPHYRERCIEELI